MVEEIIVLNLKTQEHPDEIWKVSFYISIAKSVHNKQRAGFIQRHLTTSVIDSVDTENSVPTVYKIIIIPLVFYFPFSFVSTFIPRIIM